jgi:hypothetical protein
MHEERSINLDAIWEISRRGDGVKAIVATQKLHQGISDLRVELHLAGSPESGASGFAWSKMTSLNKNAQRHDELPTV